jgi:hypothetical protein
LQGTSTGASVNSYQRSAIAATQERGNILDSRPPLIMGAEAPSPGRIAGRRWLAVHERELTSRAASATLMQAFASRRTASGTPRTYG